MDIMNIRLKDIDWGEDEAKGDDKLPTYFVEPDGFYDILKGKKRYVIGRKGTGKTAICTMIENKAKIDSTKFISSFSLKSFPVNNFEHFRDTSLIKKSQLVPIWKYLFVVEISKLILSDCSAFSEDRLEGLRIFINKHPPSERVVLE